MDTRDGEIANRNRIPSRHSNESQVHFRFVEHWLVLDALVSDLSKYRPQEQARWDRPLRRAMPINAASPPDSGIELGDLDPPIRALGVAARQKSPCRRAPASRLP